MKPAIKRNKIVFTILFLLLFQDLSISQGTWERLNSPTVENLTSVYFVDSLYGWAAGFSGTIIHTSNGGADWVIQNSNTINNIYDIFFLNRNLGWAVCWEVFNYPFGTYVLKTTNGGENWSISANPEENIFSQCILFLDSSNGWMGGKPYPIVRTTDGGLSWTQAQLDSSAFSQFPVYDIQFYGSNIGYASGGAIDCCGIIWWTTNGGINWSVIDTPFVALEPIYQLHIIDTLNVLGVGGDFESWGFGVGMMRTSDGGSTWQFEYIGIGGVAWDIDFRTDKEVWSPLGGERKLIFSLDSGLTWTAMASPDSVAIFKTIFPDSLHGFGVGSEGAILKYKPNVSDIETEYNSSPENYVLEQNYPNPFNPRTIIQYSVNSRQFILLKVYDVLGNEVATLVNEEKPAGRYEVEFDARKLSSGIYYYVLSAPGCLSSKKMVLLR